MTMYPSKHLDFSLVRPWAENSVAPCLGFWPTKTEIIKEVCFKMPTLWQVVTQQWKTNTDNMGEVYSLWVNWERKPSTSRAFPKLNLLSHEYKEMLIDVPWRKENFYCRPCLFKLEKRCFVLLMGKMSGFLVIINRNKLGNACSRREFTERLEQKSWNQREG